MAKPHVRIRMYRVGFGDCFLVTLTGPSGDTRHLLFDCGVHPAGNLGTLEEVVADIAEETDRKLDLIVASHAHEDHIAGYGRHGDVFATFQIGEVWLPWTEDLKDKLAIRLRQKRAAMLGMLQAHFRARPPSAAAQAALDNVAFGRNEKALDGLRTRFGTPGQTTRYVEVGDEFTPALGIPGLSLRVLGPTRDEAFLKRMNPPKEERFLRLGAAGAPEVENAFEPFAADERAGAGDEGPRLTDAQAKELRAAATGSLEGLAFVLDQALNNSSVVVLVSYLGRNLLFPGDAQFGGWKHWIEEPEGAEILAGLDFYKVSHHGSENATPKSALLGMTSGAVAAMVSTQSKPWESIPDKKLMDALREQTASRVVRSDSLLVAGVRGGPELAALPGGITEGKLWYDLMIEV